MTEFIDSLGAGAIFSIPGSNNSYYQVKIHAKDYDETEFSLGYKLHRFIRRPIALENSFKTFQRRIDFILAAEKCQPTLCILA